MVVLLVHGRAGVAECRMQACPVVPALDEAEDGCAGGAPRGPDVRVDELFLEGREEAFGDRVVPTRPWSADARPGVIAVQDFAVRRAGVLTPAVRMTDEACRRRRLVNAMCSAAVASSVRRWSVSAQPTTFLE